MKNVVYSLVLLAAFGCASPPSITLTNSSDNALQNQPIVLQRSDFDLQQNEFLIFSTTEINAIPAQFDDMDGDGTWDEVALELDFGPGASLDLSYKVVGEDELPSFEQKTGIHFGYSPNKDGNFTPVSENVRPKDHVAQSKPYIYQYEGPGWESELIAYRIYFDSRNGKDIFGKTEPGVFLEKVGLGENYHELQEWGMDVLKVGNSLGSGSLAMLKNDSIYRLTGADEARFRIVTQGPVRSIIELTYDNWKVEDASYDLIETISIWAGKRHFQSDVTLTGNGQDTLVTGIVNLHDLESKLAETQGAQVMYTYGIQSENKDLLGMGLIIPNDNFIAFDKAPEEGEGVVDTYTAYLKPANGKYRFAFYTGWELENEIFKTEDGYLDGLKAETTFLNNPITIKK